MNPGSNPGAASRAHARAAPLRAMAVPGGMQIEFTIRAFAKGWFTEGCELESLEEGREADSD